MDSDVIVLVDSLLGDEVFAVAGEGNFTGPAGGDESDEFAFGKAENPCVGTD